MVIYLKIQKKNYIQAAMVRSHPRHLNKKYHFTSCPLYLSAVCIIAKQHDIQGMSGDPDQRGKCFTSIPSLQ